MSNQLKTVFDANTAEHLKQAALLATQNGQTEILRHLIKAYPELLNTHYEDRLTPLKIAIEQNHLETALYLAEQNSNEFEGSKEELLSLAIYGNRIAERLINKDPTLINKAGKDGWTPLMNAIHSQNEAVALFLIEQGADANAVNKYGRTPLSSAAWEGYDNVVKALLLKGADKNGRGISPLCEAAGAGNEQIIHVLLAAGADVNAAQINNGQEAEIPLAKAVTKHLGRPCNEEIPEILITAGADVNKTYNDPVYGKGITPLHVAAATGYNPAIHRLLANDANVNAVQQETGYTPLTKAIYSAKSYGNRSLSTINILLRNGADIHVKTTNGSTLLSTAAAANSPEMITFLVENGLNIDEPNFAGQTPLIKAIKHGASDAAIVLVDLGADTTGIEEAVERYKSLGTGSNYTYQAILQRTQEVKTVFEEMFRAFGF